MIVPHRQIRAVFDDETITVYQAYSPHIAKPAVAAQTFVPPFSRTRMTWIKPSFLWMMYRCGWATKPGQEHVLAIRIGRAGFEEALSLSCLTHFDPAIHADYGSWQHRKAVSPVRVQWDPERTVNLERLPWRSLQLGLGGLTVTAYADDWIREIRDITEQVHRLRELPPDDRTELPDERPYPLPAALAALVGAGAT